MVCACHLAKNISWKPFVHEDVNGKQTTENREIPKRKIDHEDSFLVQIKTSYGKKMMNMIIKELLLLEKYNPSSRVPITLPWHEVENRELRDEEICELLSISEEINAKKNKRKRSRVYTR
mmetsp:Transcript_12979/g.17750  ORF Transcript_12979/g.17750 Transcript_12979/m.17750 type:complete len:120 (-) Transcript_12979:79-438(-)